MKPDSKVIADMRENYEAGSLRRADLSEDPFAQFSEWFSDAVAAKVREPNAMTLATVGLDGLPMARTVLLKQLESGEGFGFYTNYESRKAGELANTPFATVLFFWKELERQIQIRGSVEKLSREDSEAYFFSRPYGSRIGAWVSEQSRVISDRSWLEARNAEYREKYPETDAVDCVPLPPFWGGYVLKPSYFEFWQGQPSRLHDRFSYEKADDTPQQWSIRRLSP